MDVSKQDRNESDSASRGAKARGGGYEKDRRMNSGGSRLGEKRWPRCAQPARIEKR